LAETRALGDLTSPEVAAATKRGAGVVLPVGATEQHGPHLPILTDSLLAADLAAAIAEPLELLVAPTLSYGYRSRPLSGGGEGFAGTISLSGQTLTTLVAEVLGQLIRHGFLRLCVLSWHFENAGFVYEGAWLAHERAHSEARIVVHEQPGSGFSPELMANLFPDGFPGWDVEHAAILETSLMLHLHPQLVHFDRAVDDQSPRRPSYDVVPTPSDLVAASGVLWKATQASAEKGRQAWKETVESVVGELAQEPAFGPAS
jgi:creatinine amidohydrolase